MVWTRAGEVRTAVVRAAAAPAAVVVMVALALVVVGCSDDEPEPKPGPAETSSVDGPSPGPTPSTATGTTPGADGGTPVPPPEMDRVDEAGAEAFAKHYFALVNHAQATGELEALEAVSLPGCEACTGGRDWIAQTHRDGGSIEGGDFVPLQIRASRVATGDGDRFRVELDLSTTAQRVVGPNGKEISTAKAGTFSVHMSMVHLAEQGWRVAFWEEV